tara:strand:+ start:526 stop:1125 length:600 start_codon:yes stop_codon:yes gene_type:complete
MYTVHSPQRNNNTEEGDDDLSKDDEKNPNHYVDNKEFYKALCEWKDEYNEAMSSGDDKPPLTNYIGECFVMMAEGLSKRSSFANYTFRDDMVGDAIENCILYAHNFNPEKSKNAFSYFTQMMYYAFLRRIQKEKKQMYIKYKVLEQMDDYKGTVRWSDDDPHEKLSAQKQFRLSDNDIEKYTPKKKKKKGSGGTLDSLL